jgi:hypothetical protein
MTTAGVHWITVHTGPETMAFYGPFDARSDAEAFAGGLEEDGFPDARAFVARMIPAPPRNPLDVESEELERREFETTASPKYLARWQLAEQIRELGLPIVVTYGDSSHGHLFIGPFAREREATEYVDELMSFTAAIGSSLSETDEPWEEAWDWDPSGVAQYDLIPPEDFKPASATEPQVGQ